VIIGDLLVSVLTCKMAPRYYNIEDLTWHLWNSRWICTHCQNVDTFVVLIVISTVQFVDILGFCAVRYNTFVLNFW